MMTVRTLKSSQRVQTSPKESALLSRVTASAPRDIIRL